jgi:type II pantothenate kinase
MRKARHSFSYSENFKPEVAMRENSSDVYGVLEETNLELTSQPEEVEDKME